MIAPPCVSENRVVWYSVGLPSKAWNCQPKSPPQKSRAVVVSPAGISTWTI